MLDKKSRVELYHKHQAGKLELEHRDWFRRREK